MMDPMGDKNRLLQFDFSEYNKVIFPNKIIYSNEEKTFKILDEEGRSIKELDLKEMKKRNKQTKINDTQVNSDVLKIPIYNNIIVQQYFKNHTNVKIVNAQFEADVSIGILVKKLLSEGVDKEDITIISRDSDMISYSNGVYVQSDREIIKQEWIQNLQCPEYLFICGSSYYPPTIQIEQFFQSKNQQEIYNNLKQESIKNMDIQFIISDIIYTHYDKINVNTSEQSDYYGITSLQEAIFYNTVFLQSILKTKLYYTSQQLKDIFGFELSKKAFNNNQFIQFFRQEEKELLEYYKKECKEFFM